MPVLGREGADAGIDLLDSGEELGEPEIRQRLAAAELQNSGHLPLLIR
jgi:hypothetical protein